MNDKELISSLVAVCNRLVERLEEYDEVCWCEDFDGVCDACMDKQAIDEAGRVLGIAEEFHAKANSKEA